MVRFFLHIYDYLQQHRRLCMSLLLLFTAVLFLMVSSLKYNENIYDFLPVSGNEQKAISLYQDISGGQRIFVMFNSKDGNASDDTEKVTASVDTFAQRLQEGYGNRHIKEITTQVDFEKVAGITDFIYHNMPLMLTDSDYVKMEQSLAQPDYVGNQLAEDVQLIMMPATGFFSTNISNDPLGLFTPVMERLQARQRSMPIEIDNGYIFTQGQKYAVAMLTSPYGAMESANNSQLVNYVDSVAQQTIEVNPDVEVSSTGSPVIAVGNARQIKTDSQWAISIAVTLILLLLIFAFRKVKNLILIGLSIVFGWLFAMGFIAVLRSDVSLIVLGIGSIIIGIAVNYPLHFIAHTDHGGTIREVLKDMVAPLLIGNITTVGAFAALMPLDAPALRDLGLFAAFMLVGTILFVLIFLPHLVKQKAHKGEERLTFGKISAMTPERHRWLLLVIFILTIVFGYFSLGTSFDTNMHHINYMTPEQQQLLGDMNASAGLSDTTNIYVVSEGDTWEEALQSRTKIAPILEEMRNKGAINSFSDVTLFIASREEQQKRIDRWNEFWSDHRNKILTALKQTAPQYEFAEDAFEEFENIVSAEYTPQPFEYFEPIQNVLLSNSFSQSTGNCSVIDVIDATGKDISQAEASLNERLGANGYAFDFMGMNGAVARSLSNDFNYIGFACGFIVFLFLWLSFGRIELSLLAFLPMAMGWLWILGLMFLFGMQFNIVNVILATFIFGQGDDYTIFMTDGLINEFAYKRKLLPSFKNSIVISALIMFIGIGSLIVAKHPALHSLAEVTIVGMLTVVLMAWVVPPTIYGWLVRTKTGIRRTPVTMEKVIRTSLCTIIYIIELTIGCILGIFLRLLPIRRKVREAWFHRFIYRVMRMNVKCLWGVKFHLHNPHDETFNRGSILMCNHQSMLDPIYLLSLNPRILLLISPKVWKNPIVYPLFRLAGYINLNQPMESLQSDIAKAVDEGYNVVIFPEGKRNDDTITRFHKGAFYLADEIGADILPVYLHGANHVMPKGSALASRGQIDIEIGQRLTNQQMKSYGGTHLKIANSFHKSFVSHYNDLKKEYETTHFFHHYIIYKYIYKGISIEKETRHLLKKYDDFSEWIDGYECKESSLPATVSVVNAGRGQFSLLFALVHPDIEVHSYAFDEDDVALLSCCEPRPQNLHVHYAEDESSAYTLTKGTDIINLTNLLK